MIHLLVFCLILAFLFSGMEAGVLSLNRVRLRYRALKKEPAAIVLDRLLEHPTRLMATVVLVTTCARIAALSILFAIFSERFGSVWAAFALLLSLPAFAFGFEFFPKALFRRFPYKKIVPFARILVWTDLVLSPLAMLVLIAGGRLFNISEPGMSRKIVTLEEIRKSTNDSCQAEFITPMQKHFIHSILNARECNVLDLSVPVSEVQCVKDSQPVRELYAISQETGVEYLPVVGRDGQVGGMIRIFDLLVDRIQSGTAQSYQRRMMELPSNTSLLEALQKMRASKLPMALVREGNVSRILFAETIVSKLLLGQASAKPNGG